MTDASIDVPQRFEKGAVFAQSNLRDAAGPAVFIDGHGDARARMLAMARPRVNGIGVETGVNLVQ